MKEKTKKALVASLERLLEGEPTNLELKKKAKQGKLKVNNSTVEKEAGLSVGSLRNHPDIKAMIKDCTLTAKIANSDSASTEADVLKDEIDRLKQEKTKLKKLKSKYLSESKKSERALATQAAINIKVVQELMEMLPKSLRENAMDKVVRSRPDNVIKGNFRD
ncbi:bacterioferritin comigratory protein [Vibrio harveyi]|uniref:bacterioferritin comigratory protein n=1 Tax=Vibrio harveyi TaxID=669 RepID=UPI00234DDE4F|nr:bacterioferritin comigratory protein [Vibrio harveyi]WCP81571.1 bacterioferritin comigratory protein [Vibrio harveyi]